MPDPDIRRRQILKEIAELGFCLPGSVVDRSSRCGNQNCHCHADPAHLHGPYRSWTRKVAGKTVTRRFNDDQMARYGAWFDNARRLRQLVTELESLSARVVDEAEGWTRK